MNFQKKSICSENYYKLKSKFQFAKNIWIGFNVFVFAEIKYILHSEISDGKRNWKKNYLRI